MKKIANNIVDEGTEKYFLAVMKEREDEIDDCIDYMEEAANLGNVNALYSVGTWYNNGLYEYEMDTRNALSLFEEAINKGHAMAAHESGIIFETGDGVHTNFTKAFKCYQIAVYLGSHRSLLALSRCYKEGVGTEVDQSLSSLLYYKYFKEMET